MQSCCCIFIATHLNTSFIHKPDNNKTGLSNAGISFLMYEINRFLSFNEKWYDFHIKMSSIIKFVNRDWL